ncbi:hypothetical protein CSB69_0169 [Morganella morganii]|nr:hypothetical protein CSB69_0169 [Morganella morganii]EMP52052.1 hypothetical protein C790_00522 [Morganella morganii SC01]
MPPAVVTQPEAVTLRKITANMYLSRRYLHYFKFTRSD